MTLLAALRGKDGLVMAADSRGTFGDPRQTTAQNDAQQKAHILSPHVAALAAGSGEVGALVILEAKKEIDSKGADGVTQVMEILRGTARRLYGEWFPTVPAVPSPVAQMGQEAVRPTIAFLVAGYELDENQTPRIYQLVSDSDFAPMLHDYGFALAGVAQYGLYLLNRLYEPDRNVLELTALAIYVITETASQDGKVGGPVNVIAIKPEEGCAELDRNDVESISKANGLRQTALRRSFYERTTETTSDKEPEGNGTSESKPGNRT